MSAETVKVMVRVRPMNQREKGKNCLPCIEIDDKTNQITLLKAGDNNGQKSFTYDYVFGQNVSQQIIYEQTAFPLVENVVEGYNGTIFAYGQTGCGKTHTMIGEPSNDIHKGIIPRTFDHIINVIQTGDQIDKKYLVRCAYIEIYNEEIHDLLAKDVKAKMEMKESPEHGLFIKDLTIQVVKSVQEMDKYMAIGTSSRSTGETAMNKDSSRSHCIFTIYIECSVTDEKGNSRITAGKLNLVDLAGSERQSKTQATGERLKEATKINLSLSALGNVISALVDGKTQHIPYRDSKLTRLLQDSLGGNTKTIMIAAVSPADDNYDETQSTLRYASRAKQIKNQPKVNEDPKDAQLREYAEEIKRLKELLIKQNTTTEIPLQQIQKTNDVYQKANDIMTKSKVLDIQKENKDLQQQKDKLVQEMQQRDEQVKKEREEREKLQKLIEEKEQQFLSGGRADDEEKKKFRQLQLKIRSQKKDHDRLVEESQRKQEELLKMEQNYKSINEEVEQLRSLVTYLRKKYQEALNDNRDLEKEQEESKEDLLETIRTQEKELKQVNAILKIMLSNDEIDAIRGASTWIEENKEYIVPPFSFKNKKVYFPKLPNQQALEFIDQEKTNRDIIFENDIVEDFYENEFRSSGQHFRIKSNGQNLSQNNSNQNINNKQTNNVSKKAILNEQTMQMIKIRESYDKEKYKSNSIVNQIPSSNTDKRVLHAQLQPISQDEYIISPAKNSIIQNNSQLAGNSVFILETNVPDTGSKPNKAIQLQPIQDKPPLVPKNETIFYDGPTIDNTKKPNRLKKLDKLA